MNDRIVALFLFAISGVFLYICVQCVLRGMIFESIWQGIVAVLFMYSGIKEWRK